MVHLVIELFQQALGDLDLPACISLLDAEGLTLYSVGQCDDLSYANLVILFEESKKQLERLNKIPTGLIINTNTGLSYYIHELGNTRLFVVVYSEYATMLNIFPLLEVISDRTEQLIEAEDLGD